MPNNSPKKPTPQLTKKHLARMQREQRWRRWLVIGTVVVVILVVGVILYGLVLQPYMQSQQAMATVDQYKVTTKLFQEHARFQRANLINQAERTYQFAQAFTDPSFQSSFASQLEQYKSELDPSTLGKQVLDGMVDDYIIQKEANKRGITVTDAELQTSFNDTFGYFPNGTPTTAPTLAAIPTSTLSPLQLTLTAPTPTAIVTATQTTTTTQTATPTLTFTPTVAIPTETATPTEVANPTATPIPTATPDKVEGLDAYKSTIKTFDTTYGVNETTFRNILDELLKAQLYRQRLQDSVLTELKLSRTQPEVWARHILVADEQTSKDIYDRLQKGENFCKLAAEYSTDTSNKDTCGDLGWFGKNKMVKEFEDAAFALKVGEISQPVKSQFGYHIIQSMGNEDRPLSDTDFQTLQQTQFQQWLDLQKKNYKIATRDDLIAQRAPSTPTWPTVLDDFITQAQQQQSLPQVQPTP